LFILIFVNYLKRNIRDNASKKRRATGGGFLGILFSLTITFLEPGLFIPVFVIP